MLLLVSDCCVLVDPVVLENAVGTAHRGRDGFSDELVENVESLVMHGYYGREAIVEDVLEDNGEELAPNDEEQLSSLETLIDEIIDGHTSEVRSWPKTTDCDRLFAVFDALRPNSFLTLENCRGASMDDTVAALAEAAVRARREGWSGSAFCLFRAWDVMDAMAGEGLKFYVGAFQTLESRDDEVKVALSRPEDVWQRVATVCHEQGLQARESDQADAILLQPFRWQCRRRDPGPTHLG